MSDMKCPFCQQELKYDAWNEVYMCRNPNCKHLLGFGTKELWQELMRTKKQLDVAVDALKEIDKTRCAVDANLYAVNHKFLNAGNVFCWTTIDNIHNALEQIKALEQKD